MRSKMPPLPVQQQLVQLGANMRGVNAEPMGGDSDEVADGGGPSGVVKVELARVDLEAVADGRVDEGAETVAVGGGGC